MQEIVCQICKKPIYRVEFDYLIGQNHLKCELETQNFSLKYENE